MDSAELRAWLRLSLSSGVGNGVARRLLAEFGSAQAIFEQTPATLRQLDSDRLANAITTEPVNLAGQLQTTLDWLAAGDDRAVVALGDAAYPAGLLDTEDPPLMLYMLGAQVDRAHSAIKSVVSCLAIVGSRNPTPQGQITARQFAKALGQAGLCVVSGLALGVDAAAHAGALEGGAETIAVVGTGLDRIYPKQNLALARQIAQQGLIISEYPLGTPPLPGNFPKRNRIISGLSQGVLVVEAALKSGSLITARLAVEQGKDVFAIPGSIHSPQSRGCHALIKQGAKLVETAEDVLEELKMPGTPQGGGLAGHDAPDSGSDDAQADPILTALGFDAASLDTLQARTGLPTDQLQAQLLELELDGHIARLPGGQFQRLGSA